MNSNSFRRMFGSFLQSPLVDLCLQSPLGHGSRHCLCNHYFLTRSFFERYLSIGRISVYINGSQVRVQAKGDTNGLNVNAKKYTVERPLHDANTHLSRRPDISVDQICGVNENTHDHAGRIDPGRVTEDSTGRIEGGENAVAQKKRV